MDILGGGVPHYFGAGGVLTGTYNNQMSVYVTTLDVSTAQIKWVYGVEITQGGHCDNQKCEMKAHGVAVNAGAVAITFMYMGNDMTLTGGMGKSQTLAESSGQYLYSYSSYSYDTPIDEREHRTMNNKGSAVVTFAYPADVEPTKLSVGGQHPELIFGLDRKCVIKLAPGESVLKATCPIEAPETSIGGDTVLAVPGGAMSVAQLLARVAWLEKQVAELSRR